eukprot:250720_1
MYGSPSSLLAGVTLALVIVWTLFHYCDSLFFTTSFSGGTLALIICWMSFPFGTFVWWIPFIKNVVHAQGSAVTTNNKESATKPVVTHNKPDTMLRISHMTCCFLWFASFYAKTTYPKLSIVFACISILPLQCIFLFRLYTVFQDTHTQTSSYTFYICAVLSVSLIFAADISFILYAFTLSNNHSSDASVPQSAVICNVIAALWFLYISVLNAFTLAKKTRFTVWTPAALFTFISKNRSLILTAVVMTNQIYWCIQWVKLWNIWNSYSFFKELFKRSFCQCHVWFMPHTTVSALPDELWVPILWASFGVSTIILIYFWIFHFRNIFCVRPTEVTEVTGHTSLSKTLKYLHLSHVSAYIVANITWSIWWYLWLYAKEMNSEHKQILKHIFHVTSIIFGAVGNVAFLSIFVFKSYSVFHGTQYQIPRQVLYGWMTLLSFIFIAYVMFVVDIFVDIDNDLFNDMMFPSLVILNLITGFSLLYSFGSRLFTLAMTIRTPSSKKDQLLRLVSKNTLLGGVAVVVSQIFWCVEWIELYKKHHCKPRWPIWSHFICLRWTVRAVAIVMETCCVYLSLAVNKGLFGRLCGKWEHRLLMCYPKPKIKRK